MLDSTIRPAVIVLPKSTASASAQFFAANRLGRLFFSFASLNRVNVRGPRVPYPELSRGGGLGGASGIAETNRPFGGDPIVWSCVAARDQRGSTRCKRRAEWRSAL